MVPNLTGHFSQCIGLNDIGFENDREFENDIRFEIDIGFVNDTGFEKNNGSAVIHNVSFEREPIDELTEHSHHSLSETVGGRIIYCQ